MGESQQCMVIVHGRPTTTTPCAPDYWGQPPMCLGLSGLKADAIMRRDKPKGAYDVVWLIDALGPAEAAAQISESPLLGGELAAEVPGQLTRLTSDQFRDTDAAGPEMYASFLGSDGRDAERRHAHGTVAALGRELRVRGIGLPE